MVNFSIRQIIEATGGILSGHENVAVTGIGTDSRTIAPGECFVALAGDKYDGHSFISDAVQRGAAAVVVERIPPNLPAMPVIRVESSYRAIADMARFHRARVSPVFIGITGSLGKTTTKEVLYHVLSRERRALKSPKSFNNHLGVPLTLLRVEAEHEIVVLEMGTNAPGEIAFLSELARPTIGVITCVAPTHLEKFRDLGGVEKAKGEMLCGMGREGVLIVNGDDRACLRIAEKFSGKVVTFGCHGPASRGNAQFTATDIDSRPDAIRFRVEDRPFEVPIPGRHNVYNVLAAISTAREIDVPWDSLRRHLSSAALPPMRMEVKKLRGITLIRDCYNSSPQSLLAAAQYLREFPGKRKIAVLGGMLELGSASRELHYDTGVKVASGGLDLLWCVGEEAKGLAEGAVAGGIRAVFHRESTAQLAGEVMRSLQEGDVVLLKASRRFQMESVCDELESAIAGHTRSI